MAIPVTQAAPLYILRYAFTNSQFGVDGTSAGDFFVSYPRPIAGLNDSGDLGGSYTRTNGTDSVYLMGQDGVVHDLFPHDVTPAVESADANGISPRRANGSLQIVGFIQQTNGFEHGAIWNVASNGTYSVQVLTNLVLSTNSVAPGEQIAAEANAINSSGLVVGDGNSYLGMVGLYWSPPYSQAPAAWGWGDKTTAVAVNDQGTALVNAWFPSSSSPGGAALVSGAGLIQLPYASTHRHQVDAYAMSGSRVVGDAQFDLNTNDYVMPFVWKVGDSALTALPIPPGLNLSNRWGEADSVNAFGDIVGYLEGENGNEQNEYQVLWKNREGTYEAYVLDSLFVTQPSLANEPVGFGNSYFHYDITINDNDDIALHSYGGEQQAVQVYKPVVTGVVWFTPDQSGGDAPTFAGFRSDGAIVATVNLTRADGYSGPVSVHYATADGGAVAGQDYLPQTGILSWSANESGIKDIPIDLVTNNYTYLPDYKTFYLQLSGITGAELGPTNAAMQIEGSDYSETLDFTNTSPNAYQEYDVQAGASNVVVTLTRDYSLDGTLVLTNFETSDDSAVAGVDYVGVTNTAPVTWKPGQHDSISFTIPLLDSSALTSPLYFEVDAEGAIDGTNAVEAYAAVGIMPPSQTPTFQFDTSTSLSQGDALRLLSYVEQGVTVLIQSSTNLVTWQTVAPIRCTNGVVEFDPPIQTDVPAEFYRAVVQ